MSDTDRLRPHLADGERLRYDAPLRTDGVVGVTDDRLLIADGGDTISVPIENVNAVEVESFDWFLGVMSVALVGFGLLSLERSLLGGAAFAAAGVASLYRTYRRRNRVLVNLHSEAKPIDFFVDETEPLIGSLERRIAQLEAERSA